MKSHVSVFLELAELVYHDATAKVSAEVSDLRDLTTVRARVKAEGTSFLTITLPDFVKAFEKSLMLGWIDPTLFPRWGFRGAGPKFLRGLLGLTFDLETGVLRSDEESRRITPAVVEAVRAIGLLFKKVELPCSPERERKAIVNFILVEQINKDFAPTPQHRSDFEAVANVLWNGMLHSFSVDMLVPRHGPGATAERVYGNRKFVWRYWHERLENVFPFLGNAFPIGAAWLGEDERGSLQRDPLKDVTFVPAEQEQPVRVVFVPKTLKSPRVIAIEPTCMQFVQQALRGWLYEAVETWPLTKGHVNFRDQSINQALALTSSKTGDLCTMDLSDASDRVPYGLALSMFNSNPELRELVDACRSTGAKLPDGTVLRPLHKFASMGSALTFPVEAMYFCTVLVLAILRERKQSCTFTTVLEAMENVFIYGDDCIFPVEYAEAVIGCLQEYNCKVNMSKTFYRGLFRESCGMDAYDGEDVTPVYVRHVPPSNRKQASEAVSWTASAHQMYLKGYWRAADYMYSTVERATRFKLPVAPMDSPGLKRISFVGSGPASLMDSWNGELHRREVMTLVPENVDCSDIIDGFAALSKSLKYGAFEASNQGNGSGEHDLVDLSWLNPAEVDPHHLERSSVRGALTLQRRWVPAK